MVSRLKEMVKYLKSVYFILGYVIGERFSYYGMKTILILYVTNILLFSDSTAVIVYHGFIMICYFTPILGAIVSDLYLGKFNAIFYISIIHVLGNVIIAIVSIPDLHFPIVEISLFGLVLMGIGTGGIKSCISAFGGDQFVVGQEKERQQFYASYFFCVKLANLISNFMSPLLRSQVSCFDADTCYPLAFGIAAIFMVIALILFLLGRPMYKIYQPQGNTLVNFMQITGRAIRLRFSNGSKRNHWLDYADDKYEKKLINDVKAIYRLLFMFLPLPIFFALIDQQTSRWTLQASKMDGHLEFINFTIPPDQMHVLNPLMILCLIPFSELVVYPLFSKCGILKRPLQRICCGGVLVAIAFVLAAIIDIQLEKTLPIPISIDKSEFTFVNALPCSLKVDFDQKTYQILPLSHCTLDAINSKTNYTGMAIFSRDNFTGCPLQNEISGEFLIYPESEKAFTLAFSCVNNSIKYEQREDPRTKAKNGKSNVRFIYNLLKSTKNTSITLKSSGIKNYSKILSEDGTNFGLTNFIESVDADTYGIYIGRSPTSPGSVIMGQGGVQTVLLYEMENGTVILKTMTIVKANSLSMFLQVPQYLVITFGQIMFTVTGIDFSYSQAPLSMKSIIQGIWCLTEAFGNLIVVIITENEFFTKQSYEFLLFAGLMLIDVSIFAIMAYYYVYLEEAKSECEFESETKSKQ